MAKAASPMPTAIPTAIPTIAPVDIPLWLDIVPFGPEKVLVEGLNIDTILVLPIGSSV